MRERMPCDKWAMRPVDRLILWSLTSTHPKVATAASAVLDSLLDVLKSEDGIRKLGKVQDRLAKLEAALEPAAETESTHKPYREHRHGEDN